MNFQLQYSLLQYFGGPVENNVKASFEKVLTVCKTLTDILTNIENYGNCDQNTTKTVLQLAQELSDEIETIQKQVSGTHQLEIGITSELLILRITHILRSDFSETLDTHENADNERISGYLPPEDRPSEEHLEDIRWIRYIANHILKKYIPLINDILAEKGYDKIYELAGWYQSKNPQIERPDIEKPDKNVPWLDFQTNKGSNPNSGTDNFTRVIAATKPQPGMLRPRRPT